MSAERPTIELFVRSLTPSGAAPRQEAVLDKLDRLDERGVVEEYSITVWGEQIAPDTLAAETKTGERIVNTVAAFEEWADEHGVSVDRFFTEQSIGSSVTDERYTAISLPVIAMAEYVGGELRAVTPYQSPNGIRTVADRLDTLGEQTERVDERTVAPVA